MIQAAFSEELLSAPFVVTWPNTGETWFMIDPQHEEAYTALQEWVTAWDDEDTMRREKYGCSTGLHAN